MADVVLQHTAAEINSGIQAANHPDTEPTESSTHLITSGGVEDALSDKQDTLTNAALLETYTQTETDISDAVSKRHSHSNKSVLDGISASDVESWDGKVDEPAQDGSNGQVLTTDGNGGRSWTTVSGGGGISTETDPVFSASAAAGIASSDITNWNGKTSNIGTVTSVRVQATSPVQSSTSAAQTATLDTTISLANGYGDTKNPYASKTQNTVLAAPSSNNGTPSFRALATSDIPDLSGEYLATTSPAGGITSTDITNWDNSYDGKVSLDTSAQSGTTDGDLYAAIVALGWENDVIE